MNVWVELQNGTNHTYKNVNRIVERSGKIEMRGGAGGGTKSWWSTIRRRLKTWGIPLSGPLWQRHNLGQNLSDGKVSSLPESNI